MMNIIEETSQAVEEENMRSEDYDILYDDSFVATEDKIALIECLKLEMEQAYSWANDAARKAMIQWKYKKCINAIDKEKYLAEKNETNILNTL